MTNQSQCFKKNRPWKDILDQLPCQALVIDTQGLVIYLNTAFAEAWNLSKKAALLQPLADFFPDHSLLRLLKATTDTCLFFRESENFCMQRRLQTNGVFCGAVQLSFPAAAFQITDPLPIDSYENFVADIKALFDSSYDVIYASDGRGITMKVSAACKELWGLTAQKMIGKSVYALEKAGVYTPSITRLVLEKKQRVQAFQITKTARKLMVIGTPIKNQAGEIVQVINVSRDITQEKNLHIELESIKSLLDAYKHERDELRLKNQKQTQFIYTSEAMTNVARLALKVSDVGSTVLITGETGVGKEVIASFIHANGNRRDCPFIKINCSALPKSLLESELFGYEKGAFTGANKDGKPGMFELADHGTLFLDEISEVPLDMQVKLLRVLQENTLMRIGGTKTIRVDVRFIAACNRDLQQEIRAGRFREDLYYRLNVVPIMIPPLRERPDDILPLTLFFLNKFNARHNKTKTLDPEIIQRFQEFHWPGNIRELQNIVERLIILSDQDLITLSDVPDYILSANQDASITVRHILPLKEAIAQVECQLLRLAMQKYKTTTRAAAALGVDQSTISRKLKQFEDALCTKT